MRRRPLSRRASPGPVRLYVLDIDGTLADAEHRLHFIEGDPEGRRDWASFLSPSRVASDPPLRDSLRVLAQVAKRMHPARHRVYFLTGRPERLRGVTVRWLGRHVLPLLPAQMPVTLWMRPDRDSRPALEYKRERARWLRERFPDAHFVCVDDDPEIVSEVFAKLPGIAVVAPEGWRSLLAPDRGASG